MIEPYIRIVDTEIEHTRAHNLSADAHAGAHAGAIVEFSGIVRGTEEGGSIGQTQAITGIDYEVFREMAIAELRRMACEITERYQLTECVCIHRVGFVPAGDAAVYIRTTARHRREAFEANMDFIDQLKRRVPIWKHPVR